MKRKLITAANENGFYFQDEPEYSRLMIGWVYKNQAAGLEYNYEDKTMTIGFLNSNNSFEDVDIISSIKENKFTYENEDGEQYWFGTSAFSKEELVENATNIGKAMDLFIKITEILDKFEIMTSFWS